MRKLAKDLIFISQIKRDGSGTKKVFKKEQKMLENAKYIDDEYELNSLSLSNKTYIASAFNSYVVKIKP